jgi:alkaline phosphatase
VKVNNGVISVAIPGDGHELETLLEYYGAAGKSTGLVTTAYMTDATPATFGAHESSRNNKTEIAGDYLSQTRPDVLMGGGRNGMTIGAAQDAGYTVVTDRATMEGVPTDAVTRVSGQFGTTNLPYELDGVGTLPHLSEMTQTALGILANDADGFFLMVEGGLIDKAAHQNDLAREVAETIEFGKTIQETIAWASGRTDTLILVTADHETGGLTVTGDNGAGNYPGATWTGTGHTGAKVPVYAWGFGAFQVSGVMDNTGFFGLATWSARSGDANGDGKVDKTDLEIWRQHYDPFGMNAGNSFYTGDWNGDGLVDGEDLALWQQNYSAQEYAEVSMGSAESETPEPGTMGLVGLGWAALAGWRRRRS